MAKCFRFVPIVRLSPRWLPSLALLCVCAAHGQTGPNQSIVNAETATPEAGIGHDYIRGVIDTVDPASGQVSIRLNLPTAKQRGITPPVFIAYDTAGANNLGENYQGEITFLPPAIPYDAPGLHFNVPAVRWSQWSFQPPTIYPTSAQAPQPQPCFNFATAFVFTDFSGL